MNSPVPPPKPPSAPVPFRRAAPPAGAAGKPNSSDPIRLNKRMADLNMCSRREADEWIARGWVKVNGAIAEMGVKVTPNDRIQIDKAARRVSLSIKSLEMAEEKEAIEQFGSSDSGASLGDILGAALREKAGKE